MDLLKFLPKGKGTYIAVVAGLVAIWGTVGADQTGIVPESTAAPIAVKVCTAGAGTIEDTAQAAEVVKICEGIDDKPITFAGALQATGALILAALLRRGIGTGAGTG
jgi:hypothetical protein